jgi:hypothetical protein
MKCCIMLSLNFLFVWCTCLILFEFEFDLKSIDKIKRKAIRNSEKMEKCISAQLGPTQPSQAVRAPASPDRWVPPVSDGPRPCSLPLPLPGGADLSVSISFACAPKLSLCPVGPTCYRCEPFPPHTRSLSLHRGAPCQIRLLCKPPWTSTHAHREPRPRHLPTCPTSLLSTAHTFSLSPTSFHTSSPSLTLCPRYSRSSENRAHRTSRPARQKPRQATSSSVLRWGTCSYAWFTLFTHGLS